MRIISFSKMHFGKKLAPENSMKTPPSSQKKMYANPVIELLSQSGPVMMSLFHLSLIAFLIYTGMERAEFTQKITIPFLFFSAFFTWTLAEYLLHRYVFHYIREDNKLIQAFHFALHGYHHQEPNDANRLFMPPVPAALILTLFLGLFYLMMKEYAWIFLAGFETGYLTYSFVHYSVHTRKAPKTLHFLWKHHALHHFKYPDKAFGVSSRLWDRVFGTMPPRDERPGAVDVHAR